MTMRNDSGTILSKETYTYEFDRFGNWTKMVTNLVVFEGGELKREPIEVTYRNLTYYFDDSVAKMVDSPPPSKSLAVPTSNPPTLSFKAAERPPLSHFPSSAVPVGDPPPELKAAAQAPKTVSPNRSIAGNDAALNSANRLGTQSNLPKVSSGSTEKLNPTRPASPQGEAVSSTRSASANLASRERTVESAPLKKTVGNTSLEVYDAGRELFAIGDFKGAVEAFLRSIELEPNSAEVYLNLGHAYLKLNKDKDAAKAFKECMRLNPEIVDGIYGFGLASYRMRHFQDAAKAFKRAVGLRPALAKAHYGLALAYQELGDEKGVVEEYRILQTLDAGLAKQLAKALSDLSLPCKVPPYCK
jgi:predicted Zn-dependent protease